MGSDPISPSEIESWMRLSGTILLREELNMIWAMDRAYLKKVDELTKKDYPSNQSFISDDKQVDPILAARTTAELSTELFDSMF